MSLPLWEMPTLWFSRPDSEFTDNTFHYKTWKEFVECKPYKLWKPYILSSWCWKQGTVLADGLPDAFHHEAPKEKYFMDATQILRKNPTVYDKEKTDLPAGEPVEMLQIVFISPDRFSGMNRAEMVVTKEDEPAIRAWLKNHMPILWKLE